MQCEGVPNYIYLCACFVRNWLLFDFVFLVQNVHSLHTEEKLRFNFTLYILGFSVQFLSLRSKHRLHEEKEFRYTQLNQVVVVYVFYIFIFFVL